MLKKIESIIKTLYYKKISAMNVAKLLGVDFGKNCYFMEKNWGSEPYLIKMGNDVQLSSNVTFVTHDGSMRVIRKLYPEYKNADLFGRIIIGDNVFIGINTTILLDTKIGNNVIIGAGSIVKGKLDSNSVYAGVPAKYICTIDEYVEKNNTKYDFTKEMNSYDKKAYLVEKYNLKL